MKDSECVQFLQWALPRMHMRWPGFRKVRRQVCKRLDQRIKELNIAGLDAYRAYLETHPDEWVILDDMSRITISCFYREKAVFQFLERHVLPALVRQIIDRNEKTLRVWSIGSASGEEPYTISIIWESQLRSVFPNIELAILATDVDPVMIQRSQKACYAYSSIKYLPAAWRERAFDRQADTFLLRPEFQRNVQFVRQDVRDGAPDERFDLALCRNLVFTYFDETLQRRTLDAISEVLLPAGALVLGIHESLPNTDKAFTPWSEKLRIYRKRGSQDA